MNNQEPSHLKDLIVGYRIFPKGLCSQTAGLLVVLTVEWEAEASAASDLSPVTPDPDASLDSEDRYPLLLHYNLNEKWNDPQ